MSSLYKHLRIHQIFGANTDVGKTILTTALVRASAQRGKNVFYLKPVSTGPLQDADDL
jgi:bifunctional dethiobiotin synthetase / adenosylmethionine---8-amino-7-oxononanoate aminotransferase